MAQECFLCTDTTTNIRTCQHCTLVSSCSKHSEKHSSGYSRCFPIKVQETESRGRVLVATRLIKPGEIVLVEESAVKGFLHNFKVRMISRRYYSGPCTKSKPQCLGCFNTLAKNRVPCRQCGYPLCSAKCAKSKEHQVWYVSEDDLC